MKRSAAAFSLVEVVLALGIVAFAFVGVLALLPAGLKASRDASAQTEASNLATAIAADLRRAPVTPNATSPRFAIPMPDPDATEPTPVVSPVERFFSGNTATTDASGTAFTAANAKYRVSLWFTPPEDANDRFATSVRLLVTWPAAATPAKADGRFEVVTAIARRPM